MEHPMSDSTTIQTFCECAGRQTLGTHTWRSWIGGETAKLELTQLRACVLCTYMSIHVYIHIVCMNILCIVMHSYAYV